MMTLNLLADKRRARMFYRYLSPIYDRINPLVWTAEMRDEALSLLDIGPDDRVLDVGCGTGFGTVGLREYTRAIHGIDQSPQQLARARHKLHAHGGVRFYLGDAERLPFRDGTFDVVWSSGSIEYWPRPVETLREFRRVLAAEGQVLVVGPDRPDNPIVRTVLEASMFVYDASDADEMFREAGFSAVHNRIMQARTGSPRAIVTRATTSG